MNLDNAQEQTAWLDLDMEALGLPWQGDFEVEDQLTGARYTWHNQWNYVALRPWEAVAHVFQIVK
ncbi:MAG: hypothetical protein PW735_10430 [Acidobacteriaceae bacterium]|nr:hypothetical protein [Acidobacteriaceae bacterium]